MNDSPSSPQCDVPPDAERLLRILHTLARELRPGRAAIETLGLAHSLERDFGLDSLARVELLARLEREFGVRLAEAAFIDAETPRDLLHQLDAVSDITTAFRFDGGTPAVAAAIGQPPPSLTTLVDILDWRVAQHGERVHITLQGEDGRTEDISFRTLQADALALAAGLHAQGVRPGERVAIMPTSTIPTPPRSSSMANGSIAAISVTSRRASCTSPAARRTSSSAAGTTSTRRSWRRR